MYENELIEAIIKSDVKEVERLIQNGANPNGTIDYYHLRPLHFAIYQLSMEIIQFLIAAGSDANLRDIDGMSANDLASMLVKENLENKKLLNKITDINFTLH